LDTRETFITAIKANEGLMYKIASVYTDNAEDRKDLVQEIIYNLWKSFASFNQRSSLTTWMYRVAMNVAIYHLKITKRKISTIPLDGENFDFTDVKNADYEDKLKTFGLYLNNLNQLDKGIVMLYLENKSYAEIAEIIGISESNVGTKMLRIKEKLKKQISKQ
jgi:RNA polymerase sigma factor (sigma-70 family)